LDDRPRGPRQFTKENLDNARSAFWEAEHSGDTYETEWDGKTITVHKGSMMDRVIIENTRNRRLRGGFGGLWYLFYFFAPRWLIVMSVR
jgi:hypothetical protein